MNLKVVSLVIAVILTALLIRGLAAKIPAVSSSNAATSSPLSLASTTPRFAQPLPTHTVGEITWHAKKYLDKNVRVEGYLLRREGSYGIFSDEMFGAMTPHDLSVVGVGIEHLRLKQKYTLEGLFVASVPSSTSRTLYRLEASKISSQNQ